MIACGHKPVSGTSFRTVMVGRLIANAAQPLANQGRWGWFKGSGVPEGRMMPLPVLGRKETGSIAMDLATDGPLFVAPLRGLAQQEALRFGRSDSPRGIALGDLSFALSAADPKPALPVSGLHIPRSLDQTELEPSRDKAVKGVTAGPRPPAMAQTRPASSRAAPSTSESAWLSLADRFRSAVHPGRAQRAPYVVIHDCDGPVSHDRGPHGRGALALA